MKLRRDYANCTFEVHCAAIGLAGELFVVAAKPQGDEQNSYCLLCLHSGTDHFETDDYPVLMMGKDDESTRSAFSTMAEELCGVGGQYVLMYPNTRKKLDLTLFRAEITDFRIKMGQLAFRKQH